jgi:hypothetical protein
LVDRSRVITYVLRQEASTSIGLAGKKLEVTLQALDRFDRNGGARNSARRAELMQNAAYALHAFIIQREALGLRDHSVVTTQYGVGPGLWNLLGITRTTADRGN